MRVEEGNHGNIVAIDIETRAFELADGKPAIAHSSGSKLDDYSIKKPD